MLWQTLAAVAVAVALPDSALESHGCALQINDVFEAASMRVEWPGDASDEAVADAAAAVVDELPLNARPAELEDEIRAAMWRTREDGCGRRAAAYSDDAVAAVPDGAHAEAQLALAVEAFGDRLRPKASVVVPRTDVLWADPTFLLSSLRPSRDGVHARYDLYHYARGATFVRVFATALAFARRKTARAAPCRSAAAAPPDFSTSDAADATLARAAVADTYDAHASLLGQVLSGGRVPERGLAPARPRRGRTSMRSRAGAGPASPPTAPLNFGADDDARPSDVETPPPAADAARRSDL
ncbi:hypothetical protein JL721_9567 [Aureococcus anophagefferens]|nr:hypothetical protein JL721_9567 [Aureococcus anophagefferens]